MVTLVCRLYGTATLYDYSHKSLKRISSSLLFLRKAFETIQKIYADPQLETKDIDSIRIRKVILDYFQI